MNSLCVLFGALGAGSASPLREGARAVFAAFGFSARSAPLAVLEDERRGAIAAPLVLVILAPSR